MKSVSRYLLEQRVHPPDPDICVAHVLAGIQSRDECEVKRHGVPVELQPVVMFRAQGEVEFLCIERFSSSEITGYENLLSD